MSARSDCEDHALRFFDRVFDAAGMDGNLTYPEPERQVVDEVSRLRADAVRWRTLVRLVNCWPNQGVLVRKYSYAGMPEKWAIYGAVELDRSGGYCRMGVGSTPENAIESSMPCACE